jgi:hypothetical protein
VKSDTSDMSEMGSNISDPEVVPWFWNLMEMSDLVGYIRLDIDGRDWKDLEGLSTPTFLKVPLCSS